MKKCLFVENTGQGGIWLTTRTLVEWLGSNSDLRVGFLSPAPEDAIEGSSICHIHAGSGHISLQGHRAKSRFIRGLHVLWRQCYFLVDAYRILRAITKPGDVLVLQGRLAPGTYLLIALWATFTGRLTVYEPHNSFSRSKYLVVRLLNSLLVAAVSRLAALTIVHVESEATERHEWGLVRTAFCALPPPLPADITTVQGWLSPPDNEETTSRPLIVTPGQVRPDKGIPAFARALLARDSLFRYRIVGKIVSESLTSELNEITDDRFEIHPYEVSNEQFVREIAQADLVALPYQRASGSAVLELSLLLGIPVVMTPVQVARERVQMEGQLHVSESFEPHAVADLVLERLSRQPPPLGLSGLAATKKRVLSDYTRTLRRL